MTKQQIKEKIQKSYERMRNNIHSRIAKELGVKDLYSENNLWCSVVGGNSDESVTISGSTFSYLISVDGFEKISININGYLNNAGSEHPPLKIKGINNMIASKRGDLDTTSEILKAIQKSRKYIIDQIIEFENIDYKIEKNG